VKAPGERFGIYSEIASRSAPENCSGLESAPGGAPGLGSGNFPEGIPGGAFSSLAQFSEPPLGSALNDPGGIPGALPGAFSSLESFPNSHAGEAQSNC
jgi:hypothetical protein